MKKYQQLLIVSLGLVSFVCFLIYKHEYDRLRNVLEVLEVFGSPPSQNGALRSHPSNVNQNELLEQNNNDKQAFDDAFVLKNGHGVRPPDLNDDPVVVDDTKGNVAVPLPNNKNVIQTSGEVMDNVIDNGNGIGDVGDIRFAGLKAKKKSAQHHHEDSIFKEKPQRDE